MFNETREIDVFVEEFIYLVNEENESLYNNALDIVVESTLKRNLLLGRYMLILLTKVSTIKYIPSKAFESQLITEENTDAIWSIIYNSIGFEQKQLWEMSFYRHINESLVNDKYRNAVMETILNWDSSVWIDYHAIKRFLSDECLEELMAVIARKLEKGEHAYILEDGFNEICDRLLEKNSRLMEMLYSHHHSNYYLYDYKKEILLKILKNNPDYLVEYISSRYPVDMSIFHYDVDQQLGIIWQIDDIENNLFKVFDLLSEVDPSVGISEHFCNSFFYNLSKIAKDKAHCFLLNYCEENYRDSKKINLVVDVAKNSMEESYDQILFKYLSLTQDRDHFESVFWCKNNGIYEGDCIIGDEAAVKWNNLLIIINKFDLGYRLRPIKDYIYSQIKDCQKNAEWEKQRRFIENKY